MNVRELATLQSFDRTVDLCAKKSEDFKGLPTFNDGVSVLVSLVNNMHQQSQILIISSEGFTKEKNVSKALLFEYTLFITAKIHAFASVTHDELLLNAAKTTNSSLMKMREGSVSDTCRAFLKICNENTESLAPYGLTADMPAAYDERITDFEAKLIGSPEYRGLQKASHKSFRIDYDKANDILKNTLDPLSELLKESNISTYTEYKNTRKLDLKGKRMLSLKGKAVDDATGEAVKGGYVTIIRTESGDPRLKAGADLQKIVKRTAARGGFNIKSLAAGTYIITITKAGYTSEPVTVYINDGEMSLVVIRMVKL